MFLCIGKTHMITFCISPLDCAVKIVFIIFHFGDELLLTVFFLQTGLNFDLYFAAPLSLLINFPLVDVEATAFTKSLDPDIKSSELVMYIRSR